MKSPSPKFIPWREVRHHGPHDWLHYESLSVRVALHAHTIPVHLSHVCRALKGMSALELLHERQYLEARRLRAYTDLRIGDVAQALGFEDSGYFSRFLNRCAGQSPAAYRQHHTPGHASGDALPPTMPKHSPMASARQARTSAWPPVKRRMQPSGMAAGTGRIRSCRLSCDALTLANASPQSEDGSGAARRISDPRPRPSSRYQRG